MRRCGLELEAVEPEDHQAAKPMLFEADDELREHARVHDSDLASDLDHHDAAAPAVELMDSEMDVQVGGEYGAMCMP